MYKLNKLDRAEMLRILSRLEFTQALMTSDEYGAEQLSKGIGISELNEAIEMQIGRAHV